MAVSRDHSGSVPVSTSVRPASGPSEGGGPSSSKRSPISRRSAIRLRMRSSSSCARIDCAIFSPMPGVSAISSGEAASSASMSRKRCARLRPVTSPTSSIPSANSTRANGRCLEASIAASRLRADSSPKPSSSSSCSSLRR